MVLGGRGGQWLGRVLDFMHSRGERLGGSRQRTEVGGDAGEEGKGLGAGGVAAAEELEVGSGGVAWKLHAGLILE